MTDDESTRRSPTEQRAFDQGYEVGYLRGMVQAVMEKVATLEARVATLEERLTARP